MAMARAYGNTRCIQGMARTPCRTRVLTRLAAAPALPRRCNACRALTPTAVQASMAATRSEHNAAQAANFDQPDVVEHFLVPVTPEMDKRLAAIVDAVPGLGPESRVIDAGCGTGILIPYMQRRGVQDITACDLSPAMLAHVAARFPSPGGCGNEKGVRTWCDDFADLPVYMGSADAVFLTSMFGNVHDQHYALARAAQLLKPGGFCVIAHQEGRAWHARLRAKQPSIVPHALPDRGALEALLATSPFELVELLDEEHLYLAVLRIPPGFLLPAPVRLEGPVVAGFGRGSRDLAVPTANIDPAALGGLLDTLPRGVYFGWAQVDPPAGAAGEDGAVHKMVMNVGRRPTVNAGDEAPTVEVHLLHDFSVADFRGCALRALATSYLRPEMAFDGLPALQKRIKADIGIARSQLDGDALRAGAGDAMFARC